MTEPYQPYEPEESYEWDYDDKKGGGSKILWGRVLGLAVALFLAFLLGRSTAPEGIPTSRVNDLEERIQELEDENERLEELVSQPSPEPTEATPTDADETTDEEEPEGQTYVVKSGDTLRGIAETFCGDATFDDTIAEYNGIDDPTAIRPGDEIVIPPDCGE